MLKKNFVRTGFFGYGMLLLMPNIAAVKGEPVSAPGELSYLQGEYGIDTSIVITVDSLQAFSDNNSEKVVLAPTVQLNKNASKFVKSYLKREDEALTKVKGKSKYYFQLIDTIFSKYGLPLELKYLAVVESDLIPTAVSRVGAKGMWQFMPVTARELGLKITKHGDDRTNAYRSTVAAAKYLKDLYAEFGDWLLVIAAYNGGPGTVYKAIRRSGSRNFWALQAYLPEESRGHVKRYIGTHYYFEGKGSLTTMTKSETIAYTKALEQFKLEQEEKDSAAVAVSR